MISKHIRRHFHEYWSSLLGKRGDTHLTLGECLQCPVIVINLERSALRRNYIINYLKGHGIKARIFPATDGNSLDLAELERQNIYSGEVARSKFSRTLSRAEIACTLSHLRVHRLMVDENIPVAMVLEDDAVFMHSSLERLKTALSEAPGDWDIVQLSHNCDEFMQVGQQLVSFPSLARMPVGSAGYLIRKAGAIKMLANSFPVCYPADSLIGRSHRWGVKMYGLAPSIVVQNAVFPTEIYPHRDLSGKLKQWVKVVLASVTAMIARIARSLRT